VKRWFLIALILSTRALAHQDRAWIGSSRPVHLQRIRRPLPRSPFNPSTVASFELRVPSYVSLKVYDTIGRLVATLINGWREAGSHQVTFDGSALVSGLYFVQLKANDATAVHKVLLLK